jgi:hypothetical protein
MPNDTGQATAFLSALFSGKPDTHHILIWELNKSNDQEHKTNNFFLDTVKAAAFSTASKPAGTDVYFGVGTLTPKPKRGRGKLKDIGGIAAIHLDVDIAHAGAHKKQNLPPDTESAINFINSAGVPPSVINHSGYGLHVYWLFENFWVLDSDELREQAGQLIQSWQRMFKWRAGSNGWDVDATQDLTRVMRIPGTLNYKVPATPVQCNTILLDTTIRYTPEYFESKLADLRKELPAQPAANTSAHTQAKTITQIKPQVGHWSSVQIMLDETATVPHDVFEALMENIPKFKATWLRKRKDLQDQSASSYDMALANMAMSVGLSDQIITNLLIAFRRKYSEEKLRTDYFQRTIFEARAIMQKQRDVKQAAQAPADENNKDEIKTNLTRILGFRIEKIDKIMTDPPQFILHFPDGKYKNVGDALGITDQKVFRRHVANSIGRFVPQMKDIIWDGVAQKLLTLADEMDIADESTELGEIVEIVQTYLNEFLPTNITVTQHKQYSAHNQPAVFDDSIVLHALELWKYAKRNFGSKLDKKNLISLLRRLGARREVHTVRDERQKVCCISVYHLPDELLTEQAKAELARLKDAPDDQDEDEEM